MRTLALVAPAAGACGGDYTRYPFNAALWMNVKWSTCGIVTSCTDSNSMPDTISQCCTADDGYTLIFVNSKSQLGTSKDAFAIAGIVDTAGWTNTSPEYDATGLNLTGNCKGRSHLTESDVHCMAECPGTRDVPVTLVEYVVEDHSTKRAIVDCDADKKNRLDALREYQAVKEYLDRIAHYQELTGGGDLREPIDESRGRHTTTTGKEKVKLPSKEDTATIATRTRINDLREEVAQPREENARNDATRQRDGTTRQRDGTTRQRDGTTRQRDGTTVQQYRAQRDDTTGPRRYRSHRQRQRERDRIERELIDRDFDQLAEKFFHHEVVTRALSRYQELIITLSRVDGRGQALRGQGPRAGRAHRRIARSSYDDDRQRESETTVGK